MIIITNGQMSALFSPILAKLFADESRPFPTDKAFELANLMQSFQASINLYQVHSKKIIAAHNGVIQEDGRVTYPNFEA